MSHMPQQKMPGLLALVITLAILAAARPARAVDAFFDSDAQTPSPITDYFALRVSYLHASADPELRLDPPGIPLAGTNLSTLGESAVAMMVSEPPSSTLRAAPKNRFGRCSALASTPPVSTLPDAGTTVL